MEGRQERVELLDRAYDLSSLSGEVEAVAWGDRSMQQCPRSDGRPAGDSLGGPARQMPPQRPGTVRR
jgi:hypothetical protein